ncbi:unnamed protein product [Rangifer tarandus platyrhynchus]|uniref:Uncharacterized protein n=2 Tax=Rangifer tarandus platyrhynchus TaxID=3082113 RepID=A0ABN8YXS9_RANTA|nr:unnamed protein product [Rangifer tarandus platyrhynchus]CAI9702137.1 unnamed protein product [Rangifer tarandus platyrhynchus]
MSWGVPSERLERLAVVRLNAAEPWRGLRLNCGGTEGNRAMSKRFTLCMCLEAQQDREEGSREPSLDPGAIFPSDGGKA